MEYLFHVHLLRTVISIFLSNGTVHFTTEILISTSILLRIENFVRPHVPELGAFSDIYHERAFLEIFQIRSDRHV